MERVEQARVRSGEKRDILYIHAMEKRERDRERICFMSILAKCLPAVR